MLTAVAACAASQRRRLVTTSPACLPLFDPGALCFSPPCPTSQFAGWVVLATNFIFFFLPETKGVPVERIQVGWVGLGWSRGWAWQWQWGLLSLL